MQINFFLAHIRRSMRVDRLLHRSAEIGCQQMMLWLDVETSAEQTRTFCLRRRPRMFIIGLLQLGSSTRHTHTYHCMRGLINLRSCSACDRANPLLDILYTYVYMCNVQRADHRQHVSEKASALPVAVILFLLPCEYYTKHVYTFKMCVCANAVQLEQNAKSKQKGVCVCNLAQTENVVLGLQFCLERPIKKSEPRCLKHSAQNWLVSENEIFGLINYRNS